MYINIYIVIIVCLLSTASVYVLLNLYRKNKIYENWILDFRGMAKDIKQNWREIDSRQMFEKDDEVGVVFEELDTLINKLDTKVHDE
jgi:hypothetical protein